MEYYTLPGSLISVVCFEDPACNPVPGYIRLKIAHGSLRDEEVHARTHPTSKLPSVQRNHRDASCHDPSYPSDELNCIVVEFENGFQPDRHPSPAARTSEHRRWLPPRLHSRCA